MAGLNRTAQIIREGMTPRGGFTRAQTAAWGVPWPLPSGWRQDLIDRNALATLPARTADGNATLIVRSPRPGTQFIPMTDLPARYHGKVVEIVIIGDAP
jgi:hypothetical protein